MTQPHSKDDHAESVRRFYAGKKSVKAAARAKRKKARGKQSNGGGHGWTRGLEDKS